jgi:hypothetical protein
LADCHSANWRIEDSCGTREVESFKNVFIMEAKNFDFIIINDGWALFLVMLTSFQNQRIPKASS